jgi:hypothetical protein
MLHPVFIIKYFFRSILLTFLIFSIVTFIFTETSLSKTRKTQLLLPYTGKHEIIHHYFDREKIAGTVKGLIYTPQGLTKQRNSDQIGHIGVFCSEEIKTKFIARELVLTWNGNVPPHTYLYIQYRVKGDDAQWSSWYDMALWGAHHPYERNTIDDVYGNLDVDILRTQKSFNKIHYCVHFFSTNSVHQPTLSLVTLSYSQPPEDKKKNLVIDAPQGQPVSLPVPWISQLLSRDVEDDAMILAGVCGPTSLTMVMNYYGIPVRVKQIGNQVYDPVADTYGNWAFLAATAGSYGFYAWVQRFTTWKDIRKLVESRSPVIISIAYPKGTFSHAPEHSSDGHLLVVRGFTKQGDVVCNDPGTAYRKKGDGFIYKWHELGKAFFGHGGVAIVVRKKLFR